MGRKKKKSTIEEVLGDLQSTVESEFGSGSIASLDNAEALSKVDRWCATGSIVVDKVIAGGRELPCSLMPYGRQIEVAGPPHSGKTTLCAQIAAQVQQQGGIVVVVDTEERVDVDYWAALGVDVPRIQNLHGRSIEDVFEKQAFVIDRLRGTGIPSLIIWDSLGATFSKSVETPSGKDSFMDAAKKNMGRDAKTISDGMKIMNKMVAETDTMYIYTNHLYHKVGVSYGDPWESYGGIKAQFFATLRLRLFPGAKIKEEDEFGNIRVLGKNIYVESIKNSMAPMLMKKQAVIYGGRGFDNDLTVVEVAKKLKWIKTAGSWATWTTPSGEEIRAQGLTKLLDKVKDHEEYPQLVEQVYEVL